MTFSSGRAWISTKVHPGSAPASTFEPFGLAFGNEGDLCSALRHRLRAERLRCGIAAAFRRAKQRRARSACVCGRRRSALPRPALSTVETGFFRPHARVRRRAPTFPFGDCLGINPNARQEPCRILRSAESRGAVSGWCGAWMKLPGHDSLFGFCCKCSGGAHWACGLRRSLVHFRSPSQGHAQFLWFVLRSVASCGPQYGIGARDPPRLALDKSCGRPGYA